MVEALLTSLLPERVCLHFAWFLAGPPVCFSCVVALTHTRITEFLLGGSKTVVRNALTLSDTSVHMFFVRANILIIAYQAHMISIAIKLPLGGNYPPDYFTDFIPT